MAKVKKESKIKAKPRKESEVASLCGLVLNRLQDMAVEDVAGTEATVKIKDLNLIFGEALEQFSNA